MRGPIDNIIVGFEDPKFDGSILSAVGEAIDGGHIALVELTAVLKDTEGIVSIIDIAESGVDMLITFAQKYPSDSAVFSQDDVDEVGIFWSQTPPLAS